MQLFRFDIYLYFFFHCTKSQSELFKLSGATVPKGIWTHSRFIHWLQSIVNSFKSKRRRYVIYFAVCELMIIVATKQKHTKQTNKKCQSEVHILFSTSFSLSLSWHVLPFSHSKCTCLLNIERMKNIFLKLIMFEREFVLLVIFV